MVVILNLGEFPQAVNGKLVDGLKENMKKWSRQVPFEKMSILSAFRIPGSLYYGRSGETL